LLPKLCADSALVWCHQDFGRHGRGHAGELIAT
jgi:hypothetical protein